MVRRVILTSSFAAVASKSYPPGHVFSEKDWNKDSTVSFEPYRYSKTVAERAAWTFVNGDDDPEKEESQTKQHFDLVVLNPAFVLGPPLSNRADATSVLTVKSFLDGSLVEKGVPPNAFPIVDVRDLAIAHVKAAEYRNARGRYLLASNTGIPFLELVNHLRESGKFEKYDLPKKQQSEPANITKLTTSKIEKQLDFKMRPVSESVIDMAQALIDLGIVPKH